MTRTFCYVILPCGCPFCNRQEFYTSPLNLQQVLESQFISEQLKQYKLGANLPKIIWFMWLQGINDAPFVVKKCFDSWISQNPDWQVNFLGDASVYQYINIARPKNATNQAWSDIVRINLLAQHGGVWVDATAFCVKPLDTWLPDLMQGGFFAFDSPGGDRMISSWFIASAKGGYITEGYKKAVNTYWHNNPNIKSAEKISPKLLKRNLARMSPQSWFTRFARTLIKVYPYFWFHYLFEYVYLHDENFRKLWAACPKISADIPHRLQFAGLFNSLTEEIKMEIDNRQSPLYKLTWKFDREKYRSGCMMSYLLEQ